MAKFDSLWKNHPTVESLIDDFPCKKNGSKAFENQCAIRMGVAFGKSGINMDSFKGAKCWYGHNPSHILRAEELANWLKSPFSPYKQRIEFEGVNGFDSIFGKKGIVFSRTTMDQETKGITLIYGTVAGLLDSVPGSISLFLAEGDTIRMLRYGFGHADKYEWYA